MKVSFVGSGNVAYHIIQFFYNNPLVTLSEIYSRNVKEGASISTQFEIIPLIHNSIFKNDTDLVFICVSDDAIEKVVNDIHVSENTVVVHTAGSVNISVLNKFVHSGIIYPLQSFQKNRAVDWTEIPLFLEASTDFAKQKIQEISNYISFKQFWVDSSTRQQLHVSAVFGNNFVNYLLYISEQILKEKDIPFHVLKPLVHETISKAFDLMPFNSQTGPAKRGDEKTIQNHLKCLEGHSVYQELYLLISNQIMRTFEKKNI